MNDINCPKQLQDKLIKRASIRSCSLRDDSLPNVPNAKSGFGEKPLNSCYSFILNRCYSFIVIDDDIDIAVQA